MIRVNLLNCRLGGLAEATESVLPASSGASFISKREVVLGALLLLFGGGLLFVQLHQMAALEEPPLAAEPVPSAHAPLIAPVSGSADGSRSGEPADPALQPSASEHPARPVEMSPPPAPEGKHGRLHQLFVSERENALRIFASTGSQPRYKSFRLSGPNRVVVDLPEVVLALPWDARDQQVSHPQVKRVRAAQYKTEPPVARLVLDVEDFPEVKLLPQFNGIYIVIGGAGE